MTDLYHVGITVSDMDKSIAFYEDVLGMKVVNRVEAGGQWMEELKGVKGAHLSVAHLELHGFTLQLVKYLAAEEEALDPDHPRPGNVHFSYYVDDVEGERDRLLARGGIDRISNLVTIGTTGRRSFYSRDPDGVMVELMERVPSGVSTPAAEGR